MADAILTTIRSASALSNAGLHRSGGLSSPQSRWSLQSASGDYIAIGSHRADRSLNIDVDLERGRYILSCGRGGDRIEQVILVGDAAAETEESAEEIIASLPRLSGSDKQIKWARDIRASQVRKFLKDAEEIAALREITSAKDIIDHRNDYPSRAT